MRDHLILAQAECRACPSAKEHHPYLEDALGSPRFLVIVDTYGDIPATKEAFDEASRAAFSVGDCAFMAAVKCDIENEGPQPCGVWTRVMMRDRKAINIIVGENGLEQIGAKGKLEAFVLKSHSVFGMTAYIPKDKLNDEVTILFLETIGREFGGSK